VAGKKQSSSAPAWVKIIYLTLCQDKLIFKPRDKEVREPGILSIIHGLEGLALWRIKTSDKQEIVVECEEPLSEKQPLFILFHGNRGHWQDVGGPLDPNEPPYPRDYRLGLLKDAVAKGAGVLAVSLRGYGLSSGKPSEKAFKKDIEAVLDFVRDKMRVPARRTIVLGESLGGAVALMAAEQMTVRKQAPAMVGMVATFSSMAERAADDHPDVPLAWMRARLRHPLDSLARLANISKKTWVYVAHPGEDEATPKAHGERLRDKATALGLHTTYRELEGAGHVTWSTADVIKEMMHLFDKQQQEDEAR
jgi:pimeloyl-ACP methyl ester carboxylesterase